MLRRLTIAWVAASIGLIGVANLASAHDFLVRTTPQAGQNLTVSPREIVLDFSGPLEAQHLELHRADGTTVHPVAVGLDNAATRVRATLNALNTGAYRVHWSVTAPDGHISEGEFAFGVNATVGAGATSTTSADQRVGWLDALVQLELLAGLALALGGLFSEALFWPGARRAERVNAPVGLGLGLALCGAVTGIILALARSNASGTAWVGFAVDHSTTQRLLIVVGFLMGAVHLRRRRSLPGVAFSFTVVAIAITVSAGHASSSPSSWSTPATQAHVVVAATWVGAVAHLALAARGRRADGGELVQTAATYSRWAMLTAPLAVGLGAVVALIRFDTLSELSSTLYGRLLTAKLLVIGVALWLAYTARHRALPADQEHIPTLARLVRREAACLGLVVALSATMAATTPPSAYGGLVLGPAPLIGATVTSAALVGNDQVLVSAAQGRLLVRVIPPDDNADARLAVDVSVRGPDGADIDLFPHGCGAGCVDIGHQWQVGNTAISVTVIDPAYEGGHAALTVSWPPGQDAGDLLKRTIDTMRGIASLGITETVVSGPTAKSGPYRLVERGGQLIDSQPYARGADNVRQLADDHGLRVITFLVTGANTWHKLWIDAADRIVREVLIDPGHEITHEFDYVG